MVALIWVEWMGQSLLDFCILFDELIIQRFISRQFVPAMVRLSNP